MSVVKKGRRKTRNPRKATSRAESDRYALTLFVAGITPRSTKAIENAKRVLDQYLAGKYDLEIIDVYQNPIMARDGQITAAPMLIKRLPPPLKKFVGDLSDPSKFIVGLELKTK